MTQDPLISLPGTQLEIETTPDPAPIKTSNRLVLEITEFLDADAIMYVRIAQARLERRGTICTSTELIERLIKAFVIRAEKRFRLYEELKR
jgi:hypothetical protein